MKNLEEVRWGIIGCGDVCEVKSGPAFNQVRHSRLVAVMRRDEEKAKDFARRHNVPKYFAEARQLINDPEVNAIYIATPPASHEEYAIEAMKSGKPVYIEKPVTLNSESCERIRDVSSTLDVKASVAHYRRALPVFKKIKTLLSSGAIGVPTLVMCNTLQAPNGKMGEPGYWRTTPGISGGGLFFDLAPHQIDIFYWLFGEPIDVHGFSINQTNSYPAPDLTNVEALFEGNIYLHGLWAFNLDSLCQRETCEIFGERGKMIFSFFPPSDIEVVTAKGSERISLPCPENIQHPMIEEVVSFFRGEDPNPCSLDDALVTMRIMDSTKEVLTSKY